MSNNYVYFLLFEDIIKIGVSSTPNRRLKDIGKELIELGFVVNDEVMDYLILIPNSDYKLEARLHNLFKNYKIKNNLYKDEWFRYEGKIKKFVKLYYNYEEKYNCPPNIDLLIIELLKNELTSYT